MKASGGLTGGWSEAKTRPTSLVRNGGGGVRGRTGPRVKGTDWTVFGRAELWGGLFSR